MDSYKTYNSENTLSKLKISIGELIDDLELNDDNYKIAQESINELIKMDKPKENDKSLSEYQLYINLKKLIMYISSPKEAYTEQSKLYLDEIKVLINDVDINNIIFSDLKNLILRIKKNINYRQFINEELLSLSKNSINFNDNIYSYQNLSFIKNIEQIIFKHSASDSFIFKCEYYGKKSYVKSFVYKKDYNENLIYELKIYKYLNEKNENVKEYYRDFIINAYDYFMIPIELFLYYFKPKMDREKHEKMLVSYNYIYVIITEDIEGMTYQDFYEIHKNNKSILYDTIFEIFYSLYLLNHKLNIVHNDCHFGNILIKELDNPIDNFAYQIDNIEIIKKKSYKVCLYDFDNSYLNGYVNKYKHVGTSNVLSAKDTWTILNNLIDNGHNYVNDIIITESITHIYELIKLIINYKANLFKKLIQIKINQILYYGYTWNTFCVNNDKEEDIPKCEIPSGPSYDNIMPRYVLHRFIENKFIDCKINPFYKKYKKYKDKYIELKKSSTN